jgi:hypothetical protein
MQQVDESFQPNEWASRALATGCITSPSSSLTNTNTNSLTMPMLMSNLLPMQMSMSEPSTCLPLSSSSSSYVGMERNGRDRALSMDVNEGQVLNRLNQIWGNDYSNNTTDYTL